MTVDGTDPTLARGTQPLDSKPGRWRSFGEGPRRVLRVLRGGGLTPGRAAASVALGLFVGCLPLYGGQTMICLGVAALLRLDGLLASALTFVANPLTIPLILGLEIELGVLLLEGRWLALSAAQLRPEQLQEAAWYIGVGSLPVGAACAALGAIVTLTYAPRRRR